MGKQRGVRQFPERVAGPYVLMPYEGSTTSTFGRSRKYIARRCMARRGYEEGVVETLRPAYNINRGRGKFGELMQIMRALYRMEREVVGGEDWRNVTLSPYDPCNVVYNRVLPSRGVLQQKIEQMMKETREGA